MVREMEMDLPRRYPGKAGGGIERSASCRPASCALPLTDIGASLLHPEACLQEAVSLPAFSSMHIREGAASLDGGGTAAYLWAAQGDAHGGAMPTAPSAAAAASASSAAAAASGATAAAVCVTARTLVSPETALLESSELQVHPRLGGSGMRISHSSLAAAAATETAAAGAPLQHQPGIIYPGSSPTPRTTVHMYSGQQGGLVPAAVSLGGENKHVDDFSGQLREGGEEEGRRMGRERWGGEEGGAAGLDEQRLATEVRHADLAAELEAMYMDEDRYSKHDFGHAGLTGASPSAHCHGYHHRQQKGQHQQKQQERQQEQPQHQQHVHQCMHREKQEQPQHMRLHQQQQRKMEKQQPKRLHQLHQQHHHYIRAEPPEASAPLPISLPVVTTLPGSQARKRKASCRGHESDEVHERVVRLRGPRLAVVAAAATTTRTAAAGAAVAVGGGLTDAHNSHDGASATQSGIEVAAAAAALGDRVVPGALKSSTTVAPTALQLSYSEGSLQALVRERRPVGPASGSRAEGAAGVGLKVAGEEEPSDVEDDEESGEDKEEVREEVRCKLKRKMKQRERQMNVRYV